MPVLKLTNQQYWDMVKEIDDYIRDNSVTDWELRFISDMMDLRSQSRSYTIGQQSHIARVWEKYCL